MTSKLSGFALVEAMIALAVLCFGVLALIGMHANLKRQADVSRLRTAATNLAQDKLEAFGSHLFTEGLTSGLDNPKLLDGKSLTRTWIVGAESTGGQRQITVTVDWGGLANDSKENNLTLTTLIWRADPSDIGSLAIPLANGAIRRINHRDLSIPFDAKSLSGKNRGKSAMPWRDHSYVVFDNSNGQAIARCPLIPDGETDIVGACKTIAGKLISGYIHGAEEGMAVSVGFRGSASTFVDSDCEIDAERTEANVLHYQCLSPGSGDAMPVVEGLAPGTAVCKYMAGTSDKTVDTYTRARAHSEPVNLLLSPTGECPETTQPYLGT